MISLKKFLVWVFSYLSHESKYETEWEKWITSYVRQIQ